MNRKSVEDPRTRIDGANELGTSLKRGTTELRCLDIARAAKLKPGKVSRDEHYFHCPNHDDQHPSLQVNDKKNVWMCGPCVNSGNAWKLAAFVSGVDPNNKPAVTAWLRTNELISG